MAFSPLVQIALDILEDVAAKRVPTELQVNELRLARPDLDPELSAGELAFQIIFADLERRQRSKDAEGVNGNTGQQQ